MAEMATDLLDEYEKAFHFVLEKTDEYNNSKEEYLVSNSRHRKFEDYYQFYLRELDIAIINRRENAVILDLEQKVDELRAAMEESKRDVISKASKLQEVFILLKEAQDDFDFKNLELYVRYTDERLHHFKPEVDFHKSFDESFKKALKAKDTSIPVKSVPSLVQLVNRAQDLEEQTKRQRKLFVKARDLETLYLLILRNSTASRKHLQQAVNIFKGDKETSARYQKALELLDELRQVQRKSFKDFYKWADLKEKARETFMALRENFFRSSGGKLIDLPDMRPRTKAAILGPPKIEDDVIKLTQKLLTWEDTESESSFDLEFTPHNTSSPENSQTSQLAPQEPSLPRKSLSRIFREKSETTSLKPPKLDEESVKQETVMLTYLIERYNGELEEFIKSKENLQKNSLITTVQQAKIQKEMEIVDGAMKKVLVDYEQTLQTLLDMLKAVQKDEKRYTASLVGIANLWSKRLEPKLSFVRELQDKSVETFEA